MGKIYLPGTLVQDFDIVELAGDGTQSNVYVASRDGIMHWLMQLEDKNFDPEVEGLRVERFDILTERWVAVPTSGTSIVNLASWVDRVELAFIGWRWAIFARHIGVLHSGDKTLQHTHPLSFERLRFSEEGELVYAQAELDEVDAYTFPPPEGLANISPQGDVYSLAASLQALLGKESPFAVKPVLERAMSPVPAKRFKSAREFGEELADLLPEPNRVKAPQPPVPVRSYFRTCMLIAVGLLALCCLLFSCGVIYTITNPDFQRQVQQEYERQLQQQFR